MTGASISIDDPAMNDAPEFQPYGLPHLTVIFITIVLPFALAAVVRCTKSQRIERLIIAALSAVLVLNYLAYLIFIRSQGVVDWRQMLPMQMCDWGIVVVIVAMWSGHQRWFEVAYFWGIGGTLQAVLTPNLRFGFPDWRFISFFASHCGIIVGVVFLMLTRHYRPYPMSVVRVWLWSEFYFVVTLAVDKLTGFNYGFLLHKPEAFSILSFLSDSWPSQNRCVLGRCRLAVNAPHSFLARVLLSRRNLPGEWRRRLLKRAILK